MADFVVPFVIIALIAVIIILGLMLYSVIEQSQRNTRDLVTGFLARNATEYAVANKIEKEVVTPERSDPNTVPLTEANDEEFDKHIQSVLDATDE